ncbi:hypothetical protein O181_127307 [Austropuccinia psidii MF-1]|uniref:Uncharacterized protein n=1 Tax=Austropuccinia psidii MF-1 TaxID=1389203 RepID=A0A9Q3KV32_9BASI|nr:hypothetical protein [Austropuccinia psidii MF-1]
MFKPLEGGHVLLLTNKEIYRSVEYHRALRRLKSHVLQVPGKKYEELVEEPESFISRPKDRTGDFPYLEKEGVLASTSSRTPQRQA